MPLKKLLDRLSLKRSRPTESKLYISLYKEVAILSVDFQSVQLLVNALDKIYTRRLANELNGILKTDFKFNRNDQAEYQKELQCCINLSNDIKRKHDKKNAQLKELEKVNNKSK